MSALIAFAAELRRAGIPCADPIVPSGAIVRYATPGDKKSNCWYVLFGDDNALAGAFGCWKRGLSERWCSESPSGRKSNERKKLDGRISELVTEREAKLAATGDAAAQDCEQRFREARPARSDHAYLVAKGVGAYGIRESQGRLLVPITDGKDIRSLQTITASGVKEFEKGGEVRGNYFLYSSPTSRIYLCEGYATGASIHEATGQPFALAFTCNNLLAAAQNIQVHYPNVEIVVCADDDWLSDGNPGMDEATKTAKAMRTMLASPAFGANRGEKDTDFNDLHRLEGITAVRRCLQNAAIPGLQPLAQVLNAVEKFLRKYIVFPSDAESCAVTLWIAHTWALEHADTSPILAVTSAERECGKTRLFEVLELICSNPWRVVSPTEAVLFRKIERDCPTLLLDETDTIFGAKPAANAEPIRAILNAGNRRGATIPRTESEGRKFVLKDFPIFCAKAVAGIGTFPDTITSRSIPIRLRKKTAAEPICRFRVRKAELEARHLAELLEVNASFFVPTELAEAEIPAELSDRAQEGWTLLFQLAGSAVGDWPQRARASAISLHARRQDDVTRGAQLLTDIRVAFREAGGDFIMTRDLLALLNDNDESGWAELGRYGMSGAKLASLLEPYRIKPSLSRNDSNKPARGYHRRAFEDSWQRYCDTTTEECVTAVTTLQKDSVESNSTRPVCNVVTAVTAIQRTEDKNQDESVTVGEEVWF